MKRLFHLKDINNRQDIELLVTAFYERCLDDEEISFLFTDIAEINLEDHLPIICDFWESTLFGSQNYSRNTMLKHIDLHRKEPLLPEYFKRWLYHWNTMVTDNYRGHVATLAKQRAKMIADLMQHKLSTL